MCGGHAHDKDRNSMPNTDRTSLKADREVGGSGRNQRNRSDRFSSLLLMDVSSWQARGPHLTGSQDRTAKI